MADGSPPGDARRIRGVGGVVSGLGESGRSVWAGRAVAYAESFAAVCAYPIEEFAGPDGRLALPHRALLAEGTAPAGAVPQAG